MVMLLVRNFYDYSVAYLSLFFKFYHIFLLWEERYEKKFTNIKILLDKSKNIYYKTLRQRCSGSSVGRAED